jgi:hypothetical protein
MARRVGSPKALVIAVTDAVKAPVDGDPWPWLVPSFVLKSEADTPVL